MTATIQVQVHDSRGLPLAGLGLDDFILTEYGNRDTVVAVRSLAEPVSMSASSQPKVPGALPDQSAETYAAAQTKVWILIVLAPMSASGRNFAIAGLQKFLSQPHPSEWRFALFDDGGELVPFSNGPEIDARLAYLDKHSSASQFIGGPWISKASRAFEQLAIMSGRHAVVFASDFESNVADPYARNPHLLRVGPSEFIGASLHAQAAMYTVQATGPGAVVPFGAAAESQYSGSGAQIAEMINLQTQGMAAIQSDFLIAADETGGLPARDMQDAFNKIAADAAGFYRIIFRPNLEEADGAWHPISIAVRAPHARIRTAKFYLAPTAENRTQIPLEMAEALRQRKSTSGLDATTHVWLFPDSEGVHTSVMAADVAWPAKGESTIPNSKLQIFAQLVDESMGRSVGSWLSEREWKAVDGRSPNVHWQREAALYPGSYTLRIIAMDMAIRRIATKAFSFMVYPMPDRWATRISQSLVASRCLKDKEREGRQNLLDPVRLDGCLLAPNSSASFSIHEKPTVLVRIYFFDQIFGEAILKHWKATAIVGTGYRIPLTIAAADVRGLIASGELDFEKLNLSLGTYQLKVLFEADGHELASAPPSELSLTP